MSYRIPMGLAVALSALLLTTACMMRESAAWLHPSSTAAVPVIGVATERHGSEPVDHLDYASFRSCYEDDRPQTIYWEMNGRLGEGHAPKLIRYGQLPLGFSSSVSAPRLGPGCYIATVSGNGIASSVRFAIDSAGRIREEPLNWFK